MTSKRGLWLGGWLLVLGCGGEVGSEPGSTGAKVGSTGSSGSSGREEGSQTQGGSGGQAAGAPAAGSGGLIVGVGVAGSTSGVAGSTSGVAGSTSGAAGGGVVVGGSAYDGQGFVVHEWGTNTIVVGSDGSMQRGLHHEEEDLPGFVYDRLRAGALPESTSAFPITSVKMETPVTYFYADHAMTAKVAVDFPSGVFTQWYPAVESFYPMVFDQGLGQPMTDPVLDPDHVFQAASCKEKFGQIGQGVLQWGTVQVLAPGATTAEPPASLDQYTWSYARQVKANAVRVSGVPGAEQAAQDERFLFYRGLGNFTLPVQVTTSAGGGVQVKNLDATRAMGSVFVVRVGAERGAFHAFPEGVAAGTVLSDLAPTEDEGVALDGYADDLASAVTGALDATGLYHDEAVAMVNTWRRQWFRTPGLRVLYLMPQELTEAQIPLTITPKPDRMVRVMMIRVEAITPEQEQADAAALQAEGPQLSAHFLALGRFAEPRLRRALTLPGVSASSAATALLGELTTADTRLVAGE